MNPLVIPVSMVFLVLVTATCVFHFSRPPGMWRNEIAGWSLMGLLLSLCMITALATFTTMVGNFHGRIELYTVVYLLVFGAVSAFIAAIIHERRRK